MSARGIILVVLCAGIVVLANLALRVGLDRSGVVPFARGIVGLPGDVLTMLLEPVFCLAVVLYGFSMLLWLRLVATEPLSLAYPMPAAVTLYRGIVSIFLLAEPIGLRKAGGARGDRRRLLPAVGCLGAAKSSFVHIMCYYEDKTSAVQSITSKTRLLGWAASE